MSLYLMKERIKESGATLYDEQKKDAQNILEYGFRDDISYNKNIVTYETDRKIPIKMFDQKYTASYGFTSKFLSPHNIQINLGELIFDTEKREYWLCIESYDVSGIHIEGKLGKCSRFIRWQDRNGNIQKIPVISRNATQYNNGEYKDEKITLGSDQIMMYTQLNEHTRILDHGTKFFIDENLNNPSVYELTKPDTVDYSYMGKGMISLMLTELPYSPTKEELELGICNYRVNTTSLPSQVISPDEMDDITAHISGNKCIKLGISKTFSVSFMDNDKQKLDWETVNFKWNVVSDFNIVQNIIGNKIELTVEDENYIDSSFLLQVVVDEKVISENSILVVSLV